MYVCMYVCKFISMYTDSLKIHLYLTKKTICVVKQTENGNNVSYKNHNRHKNIL
jgi:hypothetical protein